MPNSFYNHATYPTPNSAGSSSSMRQELDLITAGFNKMPTLSGNGYKLVGVNAAGDALEADAKLMNIDFSTTNTMANAVARLSWNDTDGTLNLGLKGGNVTLQLGQEQVLRALNNTGVTITDMSVVYITGSSGQRPTVALAQANTESTSSKTFGVATEDLANNAEGFITFSGLVNNINTSALTEGAVVWLSPTVAGGMTTTKPAAPNHTVMVGYCVRSHATQGKIYVNVNNGYELDELHDVSITSVAANNMLRRNAGNTLWENIAGPAGALVGTTDTQTLTNKTISGGTVTGAVVTGLSLPSLSTDAASKAYVDSLVQGLDAKASARVATTANITLSGTQTIDGVSVIAGDRVLVKDQTSAAQNGIYLVAAGSWTRTTDADTWDELVSAFVFVESGTANANNGYTCTIAAGGTLGATAVTWTQFSGAGQITAGDGLTKTGNTLNVVTASSARIVVNANDIDLALTGVSAGTYSSVTVDTYGRVTAGTAPTTLAGYGITDAYTKTYIDTLFGTTASAAASAAAALISQNAAAASASAASTSEGNALTYKNAAQASASAAATSETNAGVSAAAAAASFDSFDDRYLGAKSSPPAVDNDGNPLIVGALYFDSTANLMKAYTGSQWVNASSSVNGTSSRQSYTATAGQTDFNITYDLGFVDVYVNGAKQLAGSDFTATDGLKIVLTVAAAAGDIIDMVAYGTFDLANSYTKAETDAFIATTAKLAVAQSFTKAQRGAVVALTDGATITPDFSLANNFSVTLGGSRTLANPTNLTAGQSGIIVITQDGTGSRTLAYGSYFKFAAGTAPTLTTTASAVDVLAYYVESSTRITARLIGDVK